jgi:hypothetical protein
LRREAAASRRVLLEQNGTENSSFPPAHLKPHLAISQNDFGNLPLLPAFLQG